MERGPWSVVRGAHVFPLLYEGSSWLVSSGFAAVTRAQSATFAGARLPGHTANTGITGPGLLGLRRFFLNEQISEIAECPSYSPHRSTDDRPFVNWAEAWVFWEQLLS